MTIPCIICHEKIEESKGAALPCGHIFDRQCIELWLKQSSKCPVCRQRCILKQIVYLYNINDEDRQKNQRNSENQQQLAKLQKLLIDIFSDLESMQKEEYEILQKECSECLAQNQQYKSESKIQLEHITLLETRCGELLQTINEQNQSILALKRELDSSRQQFQIDLKEKQKAFNHLTTLCVILMTVLFFALLPANIICFFILSQMYVAFILFLFCLYKRTSLQ